MHVELGDTPLGIPDAFGDHTALMFDLLTMAFRADLTRVFTFMMSREGSQRTFANIGLPDPWHVTSHHGERIQQRAVADKVQYGVNALWMEFADADREIRAFQHHAIRP